MQPNDPVWDDQPGLRQIGMPQVWETTTGDPGVLIATVDTGANGMPDLEGALDSGYDFVQNDFEPRDTAGTGRVARDRRQGQQRDRDRRNCWGCRVMPVRVTATARRSRTASRRGVYAVDHGARIINIGLNHSNPDSISRRR